MQKHYLNQVRPTVSVPAIDNFVAAQRRIMLLSLAICGIGLVCIFAGVLLALIVGK